MLLLLPLLFGTAKASLTLHGWCFAGGWWVVGHRKPNACARRRRRRRRGLLRCSSCSESSRASQKNKKRCWAGTIRSTIHVGIPKPRKSIQWPYLLRHLNTHFVPLSWRASCFPSLSPHSSQRLLDICPCLASASIYVKLAFLFGSIEISLTARHSRTQRMHMMCR